MDIVYGIPLVDHLTPSVMALNIFLLIVLLMIFLDKNNLRVNGFYVISISIICFVMAALIAIATGFIIDATNTTISDKASWLTVTIGLLSILNPAVYFIKINRKNKKQ